jgi:hypothetical protein
MTFTARANLTEHGDRDELEDAHRRHPHLLGETAHLGVDVKVIQTPLRIFYMGNH